MKKALLTLMFIASLGLNIMFLTGCTSTRLGRWTHKQCYGDPCRLSPVSVSSGDSARAELERIASSLSIKTAGKSASDLASDIRYVLDRNIQVPATLTDEEMKEVASLLSNTKAGKVKDLQRFVSSLQGKHVIVVSPED